jgi:hypothetical protein
VRRGYTELKSPLTGIVSLRVAREGEFVPAGAPVVTVVDLKDVWVRAQVEETLVGQLVIGQPLAVILASDERLTGKVIFISPEGEFATQRDVDRVKRDIRTFGIKVAVENPSGRVHPGMTATVLLPAKGSMPPPSEPAKETSLPNQPLETSVEARPAPSGTAAAAPVPGPPAVKAAGTRGPSSKAPLATVPSKLLDTQAPGKGCRRRIERSWPVQSDRQGDQASRRRRDLGLHREPPPPGDGGSEARRGGGH